MAIKAVQVVAAPVSVAERERFIEELMKLDPAFSTGTFERSFGYEDRCKIFIKGKANGLKAVKALLAHGWTKVGSWNSYNASMALDFPTLAKNGEWPINVHINPLGVSFTAPETDRVGDDSAFKNVMMRMAKAIMPGPSVFDPKAGTAQWSKSGGYAGNEVLNRILEKAKKMGFKPASFFGDSHPAGNWTSSSETYLHRDGWILTFGSSYGQTKSENSFWAKLSVDYKRGEDKKRAQSMPKSGTLVRFSAMGMNDLVGMVRGTRNSRVLVKTESGGSPFWIDIADIKPLPKVGDAVTYTESRDNTERTGVIEDLAYSYFVVKLTGDYEGRGYPRYMDLRTVNGKDWE
jgi:hypothetical protein